MFSNFCGLFRKLELYCVILSFSNKKNTVLAFHITKDKWLLKTSANLWDVLNLGNEAKNWKIISLFFHQIELKTLPLQSVNPCCVLHVKSNQKRGFVKNTMGPETLLNKIRISLILRLRFYEKFSEFAQLSIRLWKKYNLNCDFR